MFALKTLGARIKKLTQGDRPDVLIKIHTPGNVRRVRWLSALLDAMGLDHAAYFPWWRPRGLSRVVRRKLQATHCKLLGCSLEPRRLLITDQSSAQAKCKTIVVSYALERLNQGSLDAKSLAIPIMFHPNILSSGLYALASVLAQNKERQVKILFAGNCAANIYDNPQLKERYSLLSRYQLYQLAATLGVDQFFFPSSYLELKEAMGSGRLKRRFVWVDTERFSIPQTDWFDLLSKAEYFCCAPGVAYPYCHNLNESMACGCVPILQYGDWLFPKLQNGLNCLSFADSQGFVDRVQQVLLGKFDSEWSIMSDATADYHHRYLGLEACSSIIWDFLADSERMEMTWVVAGKRGRGVMF